MQSRTVEGAAIADEIWRDGFPVQMRDVIALEEGVDGEFPVDAGCNAIGRKHRIGFQTERREVGRERTETGVDVDLDALAWLHGLGPHEQHAVALGRRQPHQAVAREVDAGEAHLVGGAQQLSGKIVGPAVIGAGEGPRVATALRHRRAAMAADIGEGHHPAVGAAGHQDRHAGHVLAEIVAGLGQPRGEAHEDRLVAEQPLALQGRALTARIGRHAIAEHVAGQVSRAAVDMPEQPPPDGQFFLSFHGRILALRRGRATPVARLPARRLPRAIETHRCSSG